MSSAVTAAYQFDKMILLLKTWMQVIPLPITLAIVAGSAGLVVLLTSGWVISVWKVSTQGVKTNE
jgi:ABC-type transport system involved in cytochrome bd biosynthesis fused ATPase/permease subunit